MSLSVSNDIVTHHVPETTSFIQGSLIILIKTWFKENA